MDSNLYKTLKTIQFNGFLLVSSYLNENWYCLQRSTFLLITEYS